MHRFLQGEKLQVFLQLLRSLELNETRTKLTLQAHTALIFLFVKRDQDISSISSTLLAMLGVIQNHSQNLRFMSIFIDEFHDLINCTENLQLGQYTLIGIEFITYSYILFKILSIVFHIPTYCSDYFQHSFILSIVLDASVTGMS